MTANFDAVLVNWHINEGTLRISGDVYSDTIDRPVFKFEDGERISTSAVQRVDRTADGPVAVTRSGTRYLLA
jgi:hypothetical protein